MSLLGLWVALAIGLVPYGVCSAAEPGHNVVDRAWKAAGQPSPFNPNTTPRLHKQARNAPSYPRAKQAVRAAIDNPDDPASVRRLWDTASAVAGGTHGDIMQILHILMVEAIEENNETKRMILKKLESYNEIARAMDESLKSLTEASRELAAREGKDEADAKASVEYWQYAKRGKGNSGELRRVRKKVTRAQMGVEMKTIEHQMEDVRYLRQKAQNEFQHIDQVVNQQLQALTRLMRALGALRGQIGLGGQKY